MASRGKTRPVAMLAVTVLAVLFVSQAVSFASANPITSPIVIVDSPQNNKVYPTGEVVLNFTVVPSPPLSFVGVTYSLDGQPERATNGSTILTGLAPGSHTLTVYSKGTYTINGQTYNQDYGAIEDVIYFSVKYPTTWINFVALLATTVIALLLVVGLARKRIFSALRREKTARFWQGLALFLFFFCVFFVPGVWVAASNYLFPHFSHELVVVLITPWECLAIILFFMALGVVLMWRGTKKRQTE